MTVTSDSSIMYMYWRNFQIQHTSRKWDCTIFLIIEKVFKKPAAAANLVMHAS